MKRATKAEMEHRFDVLYEIVAEAHPMTVRQAFYQAASVRQILPKTEKGYNAVDRALVALRESGRMPFDWIVDPTRRALGEAGKKGSSVTETVDLALSVLNPDYHFRGLWHGLDVYVEVWCEKDALTGVIEDPVVNECDSKLMVVRGYSSITFLHDEAAKEIAARDAPTFIYYLHDYDPSGENAAQVAEEKVRDYVGRLGGDPDAITFTVLALTREQVDAWNLPTRPTKREDTRAEAFGDEGSVELDAIPPNQLRQLIRDAIEQHIPDGHRERLAEVEAEEREELARIRVRVLEALER
jgi:hypothetical protein